MEVEAMERARRGGAAKGLKKVRRVTWRGTSLSTRGSVCPLPSLPSSGLTDSSLIASLWKLIGAGAYGQVFLCEHVLDSQPLGLYAIKKVAVGTDKTYRRSVLREVEILKALRHENIS